jgi:hypothetical protein
MVQRQQARYRAAWWHSSHAFAGGAIKITDLLPYSFLHFFKLKILCLNIRIL